MPKTFHFKTTFDTKAVITDKELENAMKLYEAAKGGTLKNVIPPLLPGTFEDFLVFSYRKAIREAIAEVAEDFKREGCTLSPAKVTQVVIPRIQKVAEECSGSCEYCHVSKIDCLCC